MITRGVEEVGVRCMCARRCQGSRSRLDMCGQGRDRGREAAGQSLQHVQVATGYRENGAITTATMQQTSQDHHKPHPSPLTHPVPEHDPLQYTAAATQIQTHTLPHPHNRDHKHTHAHKHTLAPVTHTPSPTLRPHPFPSSSTPYHTHVFHTLTAHTVPPPARANGEPPEG